MNLETILNFSQSPVDFDNIFVDTPNSDYLEEEFDPDAVAAEILFNQPPQQFIEEDQYNLGLQQSVHFGWNIMVNKYVLKLVYIGK